MCHEHADAPHYYPVSSVPQDEPAREGAHPWHFPSQLRENQGWLRKVNRLTRDLTLDHLKVNRLIGDLRFDGFTQVPRCLQR